MERNMKEQDKVLEKNRRKAFWGLQLKYTLAPILWLYGSVFAGLMGMFLYNWFTKIAKSEYEVPFLEQLKILPLAIAFFVLVIGVQIILVIAFARQEKNALAMKRIPLSRETKDLICLEYSFLVTVSAFLVYFLTLCLLLIAENILSPETAYGGMELYPAFYYFMHMYRVYPIASGWAVPVLVCCIAAVSVISLVTKPDPDESATTRGVWGYLVVASIINYCYIESKIPVLDFILMLLFGSIYIVKIVLAYRRRQKNDRAEVVERME